VSPQGCEGAANQNTQNFTCTITYSPAESEGDSTLTVTVVAPSGMPLSEGGASVKIDGTEVEYLGIGTDNVQVPAGSEYTVTPNPAPDGYIVTGPCENTANQTVQNFTCTVTYSSTGGNDVCSDDEDEQCESDGATSCAMVNGEAECLVGYNCDDTHGGQCISAPWGEGYQYSSVSTCEDQCLSDAGNQD
jgi:hypothetical protein